VIERILIIGLGSIGKRHLQIVRELMPIADIRVLSHSKCKEIPGIANGCFSSIEEMNDFSPQLAVVANPAPFHISIAMDLVNLGCHLLIEKPISINANRIMELIDAARKNNVLIQLGYNLRFHLSLEYFRNLIHKDKIGRVLSVKSEIGQSLPTWRPNVDYRFSVSAQKELGGGVLLELSHELDYLRWIFGEVTKVSAILCKQSDLEIDVEDSAFITLQFSTNNDRPGPVASLCMDFVRHDATRSCVAIGSLGTLRWNALDGTVEYWKSGAHEWEELFHNPSKGDDSYIREWKHFLGCISKKETPCVTAEDGFAVMKIIETAQISNELSGKSIAIDYHDCEVV